MSLQEQIAAELNACITAAGIAHPIRLESIDIALTDNLLTTAGTAQPGRPDLGRLFLDNFFPKNSGPEFHHFTSLDSFEKIINSGRIRLSAVLKRFSEHEFRTFYDDHEMDGYARRLAGGVPMEEQFVRDTFFWSLTTPYLDAHEEENMWDCFAGRDGVRLVFSIRDILTDLRHVYYPAGTKNIPLLKAIMAVAEHHKRFLFFIGLSKVGFFYLPSGYAPEKETRLLIKRNQAEERGLSIQSHPDGYDYIDLPLDNPLARITLEQVLLGPSADEKIVRSILAAEADFAAVPVLPYSAP